MQNLEFIPVIVDENGVIHKIKADKKSKNKPLKLKNRGTGAGGANTNKNGLEYENDTYLGTEHIRLSDEFQKGCHFVRFKNDNSKREYVNIKEEQSPKLTFFMDYMKDNADNNIKPFHGTKKPDECYIDENNKTVFIIEKKYQTQSGSVCEKLQTPLVKETHLSKRYPGYKFVYMYILCPYLGKHCFAEINEYILKNNIPLFVGGDSKKFTKKDIKGLDFLKKEKFPHFTDASELKKEVVNYIINYGQ